MEDWNYYVGDPCYVVDDNKWDEFCNLLFKNEGYQGDNPAYIEWEVDGELYEIETWDSPGGDGVWRFSGGECGVDAGLLAMVPRECCAQSAEGMGILFECRPELETSNQDYMVILNGERDASWTECGECGVWVYIDGAEWECSECWKTGCESCWTGCECDEDE